MRFTDLISRIPIGKPIASSIYDEELVVVTISKINSIRSSKDVNLLDKPKPHLKLIGQISENSTDLILRIRIIASFLNLVSSRLKFGDSDRVRSRFCSSQLFSPGLFLS